MDVASISAVLAAGGVIVGIVLAFLEVRNLIRTRKMDLVMRIVLSTLSKEFRQAWIKINKSESKSYDDFVTKNELEAQQISGFFEGLGLLVNRKIVDLDLVGNLWDAEFAWEKLKLYTEGQRKRANDPRTYEWFEYFANVQRKGRQTLQAQH